MSTPSLSERAVRAGTLQAAQQNPPGFAFTVLIAVWFGIVTGLTEGIGLLLFERINWARWGPMIHVSRPIVWISPIVDTCFFLVVSVLVWLLSRAVRQIPAQQSLIFLLSLLAIYDWLTVTGRLYRFACVLLALGAAAAFVRWFAAHEQRGGQLFKKSLPAIAGLFVAAFLGIEPRQTLRQPTAAGQLTSSNSSFRADLPPGLIDRGAQRHGIEILTRTERARIAAALGHAASALGYELAQPSGWRARVFRLLAPAARRIG